VSDPTVDQGAAQKTSPSVVPPIWTKSIVLPSGLLYGQ
jgi:hypothetical protein